MPAVTGRGERGLEHPVSCPAAMQERDTVLDEDIPFFVHVPCPIAALDALPLLLRPHPGWQQRHGHRGDDRKQLPSEDLVTAAVPLTG